jgi:hypothetical protein
MASDNVIADLESAEVLPLETGSPEAIEHSRQRVNEVVDRLVDRYSSGDGRPWIVGFSGGRTRHCCSTVSTQPCNEQPHAAGRVPCGCSPRTRSWSHLRCFRSSDKI